MHRRLAAIDAQTGQAPGVQNIDVRLAAAWAAQLNLVEVRGRRYPVPHSLMQAYLGLRLLDAALRDSDYLKQALQYPRPGREFVIALVLRSRAADGRADGRRRVQRCPVPACHSRSRREQTARAPS